MVLPAAKHGGIARIATRDVCVRSSTCVVAASHRARAGDTAVAMSALSETGADELVTNSGSTQRAAWGGFDDSLPSFGGDSEIPLHLKQVLPAKWRHPLTEVH